MDLCEKCQDDKICPHQYARKRFELLCSGKYSDLKVICKDVTFYVHRSIVCPHSTFFQTVCDGPWKEGVDASVHFDEEDPDDIALLLVHLYLQGDKLFHLTEDLKQKIARNLTKSYGHRGLDTPTGAGALSLFFDCPCRDMLSFAKVFVLADKYGCFSLRREALEWYESLLDFRSRSDRTSINWTGTADNMATVCCREGAGLLKHAPTSTPQDFLDSVLYLRKHMTSVNTELLNIAMTYAIQHGDLVHDEKLFRELAKEFPEFLWKLTINKSSLEMQEKEKEGEMMAEF